MKPVVNLYKLGRLPYVKALNVQQVLFDKLKKNITSHYDVGSKAKLNSINIDYNDFTDKSYNSSHKCETRNSLILVEHEPVYTIGIRSKEYNDNYVSNLKRKLDEHKLKADFVRTNRGGLVTFHGPGQFVAYPIIYLGDFKKAIQNRSVKAYVNVLEATIIDTLAKVGLKGTHTLREYPGVWLDSGERKIAFIGISCKHFVTMHGISINCDCDLSWFNHIVSCGIKDKSITSIQHELVVKNQSLNHKFRHNSTITDHEKSSQQVGRMLLEGDSDSHQNKCPKSNIEHISESFCSSFSQYFDCSLIENSYL